MGGKGLSGRFPSPARRHHRRNMPPPLCLYHRNCLDGSAAAAVVLRKVPDCAFQPLQYGDPPPVVEGRKVFLVDIGLPIEAMRALKAQASELLWLDHHASQLPVRSRLGWGVIEVEECGATVAWKHLFPDEPLPRVLEYVRDKDLWRWQLPDSRAICAGLGAAYAAERFRGLLSADLALMADRGRVLLEKTRKRVDEALAGARPLDAPFGLAGRRALVVFANRDQNELGDRICQPEDQGGLGFDLAVLLYRKPDGLWVHSLRSFDEVMDCGTIAARFAGGGHPRSACFLAREPLVAP